MFNTEVSTVPTSQTRRDCSIGPRKMTLSWCFMQRTTGQQWCCGPSNSPLYTRQKDGSGPQNAMFGFIRNQCELGSTRPCLNNISVCWNIYLSLLVKRSTVELAYKNVLLAKELFQCKQTSLYICLQYIPRERAIHGKAHDFKSPNLLLYR
jgi:hypothetical protein